MIFANRLFTLSFTLSLWVAFLNWKPGGIMWAATVVWGVLAVLTGAMVQMREQGKLESKQEEK